ncbi:EamA family transporter [Oceanospirillum linum]|uniref:EamA domain-containing protein n=1 Tax=Oceanospirillum linum TaxID=966 RepID=A0A1T1HCZ1_OCELI|nr:EamA family transporter [Oceanospirillum linum]OOV87600.1 hypothetical protein BTA35_0206070 [Oceanospirillum linum]SEF93106.1 probable blue pigment (indigoidine) exporter [Oleiphilus messinensis]SMP12342.1 probable blue pigment (indigoidine) exporter [Oceanospirillum linum]
MNPFIQLLLSALGPISWGSTYLVTSEFLPEGMPFTAAVIRCLPAGVLLIVLSHMLSKSSFSDRALPTRQQWPGLLLLSALNIGCFQAMLFVAAYRLPGGLAAVIGAVQPLILLLMVWALQKQPPGRTAFTACITAIIGMGLLILSPVKGAVSGEKISWDLIGIGAATLGALSMALGVYLSRYGRMDKTGPGQDKPARNKSAELPLITLTGWQLTLGGLMLLPLALVLEPALPTLTTQNLLGYGYLSLFGTLIAYLLWFQGIRKLPAVMISTLGLLSPLTAVALGWIFLDQALEGWAMAGLTLVIASILAVQFAPWIPEACKRLGPGPKHNK